MGIDRFSPSAIDVILEGVGGAFELNAILEQDPIQAVGTKLREGKGFGNFGSRSHFAKVSGVVCYLETNRAHNLLNRDTLSAHISDYH